LSIRVLKCLVRTVSIGKWKLRFGHRIDVLLQDLTPVLEVQRNLIRKQSGWEWLSLQITTTKD